MSGVDGTHNQFSVQQLVFVAIFRKSFQFFIAPVPLFSSECLCGHTSARIAVVPSLPKDELAMFGEDGAEAERKFVLKVLQFVINGGVFFIGFGGFAGIQFDELVGNVADGNVFALLLTPAPEGLESSAVTRAFCA